MKCLILFVLCLASLFAEVYSLGLNITTLVGNTAVVQWTREGLDPDQFSFDLRIVIPPYYDVGIAKANIYTSSSETSGNVTVQFPESGRYMLVAVSGRNVQIGRTAPIQVPGSTTVPTPSQTPVASQTPTPSITPSPSKSLTATGGSACPKKKLNVAAIVFAVIGGVLLTALLIFAVFYIRRRRPVENKRISFYKERMVQQRSSDGPNPSVGKAGGQGGTVIPYPFTSLRASFGSTSQSSREAPPHDIEQGLSLPPPAMTRDRSGSIPGSPLASGYVVPPPRGPRDRAQSVRRIESTRVTRVNGEPTSRQRQLADKLGGVEKQIEELKSQQKLTPSTLVILEDLEMQRAWLVKQRGSMWALEHIDTLPPGYSRYMT